MVTITSMLSEPEIESHLIQLHQALSAYMTGHIPLRPCTGKPVDCDAEIAGCKILFPNSHTFQAIKVERDACVELLKEAHDKGIVSMDWFCRVAELLGKDLPKVISNNPLETKRKLDIITKSAKLTTEEIRELADDGTPPWDDL